MKKTSVSGYTMEQCRTIVNKHPARLMYLDEDDTDYPALLELYRQYRYERHEELSMMEAAFALGHAIGVRDERARRRGVEIVPPDQAEIDAAEQAICAAKINREIMSNIRKLSANEINATLATMKALAAGKSDEEAIAAGNAVLVGAGLKPVNIEDVRRNAEEMRSAS